MSCGYPRDDIFQSFGWLLVAVRDLQLPAVTKMEELLQNYSSPRSCDHFYSARKGGSGKVVKCSLSSGNKNVVILRTRVIKGNIQ